MDNFDVAIVVHRDALLESASFPEVHYRTSHVENHCILFACEN